MWNPFSARPRRHNGRNNNGQSSIIVPGERLGSLEDVAGAGTAPIVSVSVGSTGLNRARLYHKVMDAMNCAGRIQSMLVYDCNQVNINRLREDAATAGITDKIIVPEYLPFAEGFLRRVDQYESHYGAIERDMEQMVEKMERQSLISGTEPQVILEWIGFGGHAMLSYMLHDIVVKRFPEANVLPIVCFPDDRGMQQNIREHKIWDEATEMLRKVEKDGKKTDIPILLTDNRRATDFRRLDESLVTALAAVEACFKYEPSFGSLAEVTSVLNITGNRWIAVENTEISIINRQALSQKNGKQSPENHQRAMSKLAQKIKDRIFEIAEPENRFEKSAFFQHGSHENEQRIYIAMPLGNDEVKAIREDIEDQLKREQFSKSFPGTQIAYGAGNPQTDTPPNCEYVHIVKFVGLTAKPQPASLSSILNDKPLPDDLVNPGHGSVKTRGQKIFEGYQHGYSAGAGADDASSEEDAASAGTDDASSQDAASAETDDASSQDAASAETDDASSEDTASAGADDVSSEDAASAGADDVSSEDAASVGADGVSSEEDAASVEAEDVESDADSAADGQSPSTA